MTNDIDQNLDPHNIEVDGFSQQPNNSLTQTRSVIYINLISSKVNTRVYVFL